MKKLFAIAFTCVYLTLAVGVVRTTHYCMGRVNSTSFFTFDPVKCPCSVAAIPMSKKCCDDEHDLIKIEDDHAAAHIVSISPDFFEIGPLFEAVESELSMSSPSHSISDTGPPLVEPIPLFTRHCALVFYDDEHSA